MVDRRRCPWCEGNELLCKYHDEEWGKPLHDDVKHFEYISLEVLQCGLNWLMMMQKREIFRECFDDFDYEKIALYDDRKVKEIMEHPGMIRSPRKINAIINNARCFLEVRKEFGSFDKYIWFLRREIHTIHRQTKLRDEPTVRRSEPRHEKTGVQVSRIDHRIRAS